MDGGYTEDRPLTEAERLVNVHYLGHCLHENRRVWNNWSMGWCSRCRDCKEEIQIQGYSQAKHLPADVLAQAWSREHIKTAASPINGAQLRYALESEGWRVRFLGVDGRTVCEVRKGSTCWRTRFFDTQAEAVVEELAALCKKVYDAGLLAKIGLDPERTHKVVFKALIDAGIPEDLIIGISQGWKLTGAIAVAELALKDGQLTHADSPMMAWSVGNAKVVPSGNAVLITKQASGTAKIDPLMASLNAITLMATNPEAKRKSVYERRGIRYL